MRVLVTGGAGSLGTALCRRLLQGGAEVVVYDLAPSTLQADAGRLTSIRGDVTDGLHLARTVHEHRPAAIVHLASLLAAESSADPGAAVRLNAGGMVNALEAARVLDIERVVWASSAAVYAGYGPDTTIANDAPYTPQNIYAGTKILNEMLAEHYTRAYGVHTIGLRFSLMTGVAKPRGISGKISTELIEKPVRGIPARVPFGDDTPNWLWLDDAARALELAIRVPATRSRAFNIGGDVRPMRDAVEIVRGLIPDATIEVEPGVFGLDHRMDLSAIEAELGFRPEWRLEDQLHALIDQTRASIGTPSGVA